MSIKPTSMNGSETLVSIIVPVYNTADNLSQCLSSICMQSYQNCEIILVDDGSDDGSEQIGIHYAEQDARIQVIHQKHHGVSSARNRGILAAKGMYVCFVDSDDWIEPEQIKTCVELFEEYDTDIVVFDYWMHYGNRRKEKHNGSIEYGIFRKEQYLSKQEGRVPSSACNKMYKRSIIGEVRFDESILYGEDLLFNMQVSCNADTILNYDAIFYNYNRYGRERHSLSEIVTPEQVVRTYNRWLEYWSKNDRKLLPSKREIYCMILLSSYCGFIEAKLTDREVHMIRSSFDEEYLKLKKRDIQSIRFRICFSLFHYSPKLFLIIRQCYRFFKGHR